MIIDNNNNAKQLQKKLLFMLSNALKNNDGIIVHKHFIIN